MLSPAEYCDDDNGVGDGGDNIGDGDDSDGDDGDGDIGDGDDSNGDDSDGADDVNPVIPWQELIQSDGQLILAGGRQGRCGLDCGWSGEWHWCA